MRLGEQGLIITLRKKSSRGGDAAGGSKLIEQTYIYIYSIDRKGASGETDILYGEKAKTETVHVCPIQPFISIVVYTS